VAQKYEQYDDSVEARGELYNQLTDRLSKIKLALAAQYGKDSNAYKDAVKYM
jgi:formiminotetrahydrofolate cyclodeaminase